MGKRSSGGAIPRKRSLRSLRSFVIALFILLGAGAATVNAAETPRVGYVLEIEGTWVLPGVAQPLWQGETVPGGGVLANAKPEAHDHIVIADMSGKAIKTVRCIGGVCRECRESGGCYDPIQPLPKAPATESVMTSGWSAVMELFGAKPDHFSIHRVRQGGFELKRDGVGKLAGNTIDLSAILAGQENGVYELRMVRIGGAEESNGKEWRSSLMSVKWESGKPAEVSFDGLRPGLYTLRAKHGGETSSAWLLLVDSDRFSALNQQFEEFAQFTGRWGENASADTKRAHQRAYLEYLNTHATGATN